MPKILAHFHGGPWAGEVREIDDVKHLVMSATPTELNLTAGGTELSLQLNAEYVRDDSSAGGRCFDYKEQS